VTDRAWVRDAKVAIFVTRIKPAARCTLSFIRVYLRSSVAHMGFGLYLLGQKRHILGQ